MFNYYPQVFEFYELEEYLSFLERIFDDVEKLEKNGLIYHNIPASFDIETSSFYYNDEKRNIMCIWVFNYNNYIIYGRTWEEYIELIERLASILAENEYIIVYVHNLGYEFQYIRKLFVWEQTFFIKDRRPVMCRMKSNGIEYKCSLFLSPYKLEYIGNPANKILHKYPVQKLMGDWDYSLIRHSQTPITKQELQYCINDTRVVTSLIQEKIETDGSIIEIPYTNTGYVRNYCRAYTMKTYSKNQNAEYHDMIKVLQVKSFEEYKILKEGFMGGFTHASINHSHETLYKVHSYDITSSYPFEMCCSYFPGTPSKRLNITSEKELKFYLENYCCLFRIRIRDLEPKIEYENPLSASRCYFEQGTTHSENNGRVIEAESLITTLTELDFATLCEFYEFSDYQILDFLVYERAYLPKPLILAILSLYKDKTSLKGIAEKIIEYMVSKNMINAAFGMMVTDIIREVVVYDTNLNEYFIQDLDGDKEIAAYNTNYNRFLYYPWGIWVTAHARRSLFKAIKALGEDYVYSDTDSVKFLHFEKNAQFFRNENINRLSKIFKVSSHYNIPVEKFMPKTKDGITKVLGAWDDEGEYDIFKTIGAKRYMTYKNSKLSFTIAGCSEKKAIPYLLEKYDNDIEFIFHIFRDGFFIPAEYTGKNTITYLDKKQVGYVADYLGNLGFYSEESSVHMEPCSFRISVTEDYKRLIEGWEDRTL